MNCAKVGIIPHENPHTPLKAETHAEGETLQRLGGGGEKQNGFHICVLRRYFYPNDLLHHRERENATGAA